MVSNRIFALILTISLFASTLSPAALAAADKPVVSGDPIVVVPDVPAEPTVPVVIARIGGTDYYSLAEAVAAVQDGEEIEIVASPKADDVAVVDRFVDFFLSYERSKIKSRLSIQPADGVKLKVTGISYETHNRENYVFHDCTITYDGNGSTSRSRDDAAISGKPYRLPGKYLFAAPAEMEFKAWEIDGREYQPLEYYTFQSDAVIRALWQKVQLTDGRTDLETTQTTTPLEEVPDALADQYASTDAILAELQQALYAELPGLQTYAVGHVVGYDVSMQYKVLRGDWTCAKDENIPVDGVTVTLPYPAGTGMGTHAFAVSYMIAEGSKAGMIATPKVTQTEDGLVVKLTSFAPVAIGWTELPTEKQPINPWRDAMFALYNRTYTITASAGEGGSISDAGDTQVKYRRSQNYVITPAEGYRVADVLVDGVSIGPTDLIRFKQVRESHTVQAIFAPIA